MSDIERVKLGQQTVQGDVITGSVYDEYDADDQDYIYERMPFLGQQVCYRDGRKFRFVGSDVALTAGQVVAAAIPLAELDGKLKVAVAGTVDIAVTAAAITADAWAGGTITITDSGTAPGMVYTIIGNTITLTVAEGPGAIGDVVVTLANPLVVATAATDDCIISYNKWDSVIVGTATTVPLGVTMVATAGNVEKAYFWIQTAGPGAVVVTTVATVIAGGAAMSAAAGSVVISDGTQALVGNIRLVGTSDGDMVSIDLKLE